MDLNLDLRSDADSQNPVDEYLAPLGLKREVTFKSGQLNTLVDAMEDSNNLLVSTHALRSVDNFRERLVPIYSMKAHWISMSTCSNTSAPPIAPPINGLKT